MKRWPVMLLLSTTPVLTLGQQKTSREAGRFQVVNGTPEMTRNIMLLDTTTGETWILCTDVGGSTAWCKMPRHDTPASRDDARDKPAEN